MTTALLPISLDKCLSTEDLGELLDASQEERVTQETFIIEALQARLRARREAKREAFRPAQSAA